MVRLGPRDPEFMTPVIKGMLRKRTQLMKKGRLDEANSLAEKINKLIQATIGKRLANISSSKPKDLWKMVNKSKTKNQALVQRNLTLILPIMRLIRLMTLMTHTTIYGCT